MFTSFMSKALCQSSDGTKLEVSQQQGLVNSLSPRRQVQAAAVAEGDSCEFASPHYFALCGLGGKQRLQFI